jgi:hypothetical protein
MFFGMAVLIFIGSGWGWWHYVRSNPERTFYAAVENSLRTQGFTKKVTQDSGDQKLEQGVQYSSGAQNVAHGFTTVTQTGDTNANIKTEVISNPKEEYIRYTTINTDQKKPDGSALDFTQLVNKWGKADSTRGGDLYVETTLNVVPAGNLPADKRQPLMKMIRDKQVYKLDNIQRALENGRPVYTYDVTVATETYVQMLKDFDKATGMARLESVDPATYKDSEPMTFQVKIDVWSQQLTQVNYAGGQRVEGFGSHGITRTVDLPTDYIPIEELQSRLQAVQQ